MQVTWESHAFYPKNASGGQSWNVCVRKGGMRFRRDRLGLAGPGNQKSFMRLREIPGFFLDLLYPPHCLQCGGSMFLCRDAFLCADCEREIHWIGDNACRFCSEPLGEHATPLMGCAHCRPAEMAFTRAVAAAVYRSGPVGKLIRAFKFAGARRLAAPLAEGMAPVVARKILNEEKIDWVTSVPLHPARREIRGYDQAELLGRELARRLNLPFREGVTKRVRETPAQAQSSVAERRKNLVGAFVPAAGMTCRGARVLLVDDVLTTGTTLSECAKALRAAGAVRVLVAVFAR